MFYSHIYNNGYTPAAPFVNATVFSPHQPASGQVVSLLVDSGADGTLLPKKVLKAIRARFVEHRFMRGVIGERIKVRAYLVALQIGTHSIYGIRAAAIEDDADPIPERDVLNQLIVTLNGLGETLEMRD